MPIVSLASELATWLELHVWCELNETTIIFGSQSNVFHDGNNNQQKLGEIIATFIAMADDSY